MRYHLCTSAPHGTDLRECKHSGAVSGAPVIAYRQGLSVCRSKPYSALRLSPFQRYGVSLCRPETLTSVLLSVFPWIIL